MQRLSSYLSPRAAPNLGHGCFRACLRLQSTAATTNIADTAAPVSSGSRPTGNLLPYCVGRSSSQNLSVYHRTKSGGTNRTTEVKKVEGDARALAQQLRDELSLDTKINPRTNDVIIKGLHKDKVVGWLQNKGF